MVTKNKSKVAGTSPSQNTLEGKLDITEHGLCIESRAAYNAADPWCSRQLEIAVLSSS